MLNVHIRRVTCLECQLFDDDFQICHSIQCFSQKKKLQGVGGTKLGQLNLRDGGKDYSPLRGMHGVIYGGHGHANVWF